jgi:carbamoyl-phosphate synthase large subunit
VNNLNGQINKKRIGEYESNIYMMKYNEVLIKKM